MSSYALYGHILHPISPQKLSKSWLWSEALDIQPHGDFGWLGPVL